MCYGRLPEVDCIKTSWGEIGGKCWQYISKTHKNLIHTWWSGPGPHAMTCVCLPSFS